MPVTKRADKLSVVRLGLSLFRRCSQTLAGVEIVGSRRDLIAAGQQQPVALNGEIALRTDSLAQFLVEMP